MRDEFAQGIRSFIEDQILGQASLCFINICIRSYLGRVDDGHIQPGLDGMVEHDRVDHRAGGRVQPEGNVAHAQRGQDTRQFTFDGANALQCLFG